MKKKKVKLPISVQFVIIYTLITILFLSIFITVIALNSNKLFSDFNKKQLVEYFVLQKSIDKENIYKNHQYNGYIKAIYEKNSNIYVENDSLRQDKLIRAGGDKKLKDAYFNFELKLPQIMEYNKYEKLEQGKSTSLISIILKTKQGLKFRAVYELTKITEDKMELKIAFTDNKFVESNRKAFLMTFNSIFISIIIITNITSYIWIRVLITKRLKHLSVDINNLPKHNYQKPIKISGKDEITEISNSVDNLRKEILIQEMAKREMLQNMSHDIKNPIGIIKSYAEAIKDGITDYKDINIILDKTNELSRKVAQLINFVKAEYLTDEIPNYKEFSVKNVVETIVMENKYRFSGNFNLNLDNSKYIGLKNKFKIALQNIIENSIRYAKTKINIKLHKQILTIENDGPKIDPDFIDYMFKLYQKSSKGQFGIGLSVTKATLTNFGLDIKVENTENGVLFTIFPV